MIPPYTFYIIVHYTTLYHPGGFGDHCNLCFKLCPEHFDCACDHYDTEVIPCVICNGGQRMKKAISNGKKNTSQMFLSILSMV